MTNADLLAILPIAAIGVLSVALMILIAFGMKSRFVMLFALASLAVSFAGIFLAKSYAPRTVGAFLRIDAFSLYFIGLVTIGAFLVVLLSYRYLEMRASRTSEFYLLVLFAVLGMQTVASSIHLISFFLGVEVLSLSLYGLIGYTLGDKHSLEGAIKYFVLAAASSAFLLFGIALVYAENGTMNLEKLFMLPANGSISIITLFGIALIIVVFGFKLALAPFHTWSPDVYQGSPAPVTALIASGSKGAVLAFFLRMMMTGNLAHNKTVFLTIAIISAATMTVGNLLALFQRNVKRLLAYSSIAHLGYLLIPLLADGLFGASSIAFYLAGYFVTIIAAFGVITILSTPRTEGDMDDSREYKGLALRHPLLAAIFALCLVSLTGIPPTVGFLAKFYIFSAAIHSGLWVLVIIGIINSGISAFYYLRLVVTMYGSPVGDEQSALQKDLFPYIALGICTLLILFLGVYPTPLIRLVESILH